MRYAQLKAFHNVALHMGFSSAAKALDMTQPALSDQVRKLEQTYDVLLFDRSRRQISLTPTGEKLFAHTRRMFECEAITEEFLSQTQSSKDGTLTLITDTPFHYVPILSDFRATNPDVRIRVRRGNSQEVVTALKNYEADIGILGVQPSGNEFSRVRISQSDIVAFVAHDSPLAPDGTVSIEDLRGQPLVMREDGSRTRMLVDAMFEAARVPAKVQVEAHGREAVRELVAGGGVVGFVADVEFGNDPRFRRLRITGSQAQTEDSVVCLKDRAGNSLIASFMDHAKSRMV